MWNAILQRFQGVSAALQAVELDLCNAVDLVRSLREYVAGLRDQFDNFETAAKNMSPTVSEEYRADTQRKRKRKSQADDSSEPECELSGRSRFRTSVFIRVIDRLVSELDRRYQSYNDGVALRLVAPGSVLVPQQNVTQTEHRRYALRVLLDVPLQLLHTHMGGHEDRHQDMPPPLDLLVVAHAVGDGAVQIGLDAAEPGSEGDALQQK
ncbi:hypothetical protein F7725_019857 [Dissostichus mawsoni]|uniref:Uncharacterized protein n=1 Tax=Dissostichus mawsoni TaxID=36200 RepID=A0A7J5YPD9_DISMA|nr:hypothetical protein F7725_019857 [Dissostichus mawsoni]